jgi:hypothetical protein
MKINNIKILDHKTCLEIENNNYSEEIMKEFISRNGFNVDDIFDFRDKYSKVHINDLHVSETKITMKISII